MENRNRRKVADGGKPAYSFKSSPRRPEKADMVIGFRAVLEALRAGKSVDRLLVQRDLNSSTVLQEIMEVVRERGLPLQKVPAEKLDRLTAKNHQGVILFIASVEYASLHNVLSGIFERGETPLLLVLDRVTDVRNFGAIARTAECAGVHALVVPSRGGAQINSDAMKTSAGALTLLPVCREDDLRNTLRYLRESGLQIVACTEKTNNSLYTTDLSGPMALVMGSEEDGVADELIRWADHLVRIPLNGQISSLNVSVAAGVAIYEALRQRLAAAGS